MMDRTSSSGYWLRRRRKALDLTQEDLAEQVGCSLETIKKIETDVRRPSRAMAERLAECLALPIEERTAFLKAARAELATDRLAVADQPITSVAQDLDVVHTPAATPLPNGTPTFLFTDIEGSTKLWEQHKDATQTALARHNDLLQQSVEANWGSIFKTIGDAVCAVFASALDALAAALTGQRAALIGREPEVQRVREVLQRDADHLLTLTGPGGVGKTRLCLQVAAEMLDVFTDGVWFVNLAPISDPALVINAIAQTLGVHPANRPSATYIVARKTSAVSRALVASWEKRPVRSVTMIARWCSSRRA
jgi:transcriptional regulator with XRE-family HTH domain